MGAEDRQPQPDLSQKAQAELSQKTSAELRATLDGLSLQARRFAFFRLVYALERLFPASPPMGQLGPVANERIRLRGDTSLAFASTDISELAYIKYPDGIERVRVSQAFMGLYGSVSPLPTHFAENLALADYQGGPQPIREFFDVFHHRLISLLYRTWSKYRFAVMYRKKGDDPFTRRMFCAVGLDGFKDHETPLHRFMYLKWAPLLALKSRSARGLDVVLNDIFGKMGVKIEQFVGHWTLIEKPLRNKMGVMNHVLGESLTIGRYVYDGTGRFNIVLGPLSYDEYLSFLPGGSNRPVLRAAVDTFTRGIYDVMLELHVKKDEAPRLKLGSERPSILGRTAWLGGMRKEQFVITVPLEDKKEEVGPDDEDDDRGEPPPL
jgi:type VI secretion system protein ImpH